MTVLDAIVEIKDKLNNTENPLREARLLAELAFGMSKTDILLNADMEISQEMLSLYRSFGNRRANGEPFAYISGEKEFMGLSFKVNKDVLIPRPDTEILVENVVKYAENLVGNNINIVDLCCGSGCIGISLGKIIKKSKLLLVDVSKKAIEVAQENAEKNRVKVAFEKRDILKAPLVYNKKFHIAVSNPPYIKTGEMKNLEVYKSEPALALDGGEDGLEFYRKIVKDSYLFLEKDGRLFFEIGYDQGKAVKKIMSENFSNIKIIKDLAGNDRVVTGVLKSKPVHSHSGHRDRVKQRYIEEGLDAFEPYQALEMLLFYAIPRQDVNQKAHDLIERFGGISALFETSVHDLVKYGDISENTAVLINMIPSMAKLYLKDRWKEKVILGNTFIAGNYAINLFLGATYEAFYVICLDGAKGLIKCEKLAEGTINETPVYPRLVVETALRNKASYVILAHNHPSGSLKASWNDIEITEKVGEALNNIDITLLDHIIVGGESFSSMKNTGSMKEKL